MNASQPKREGPARVLQFPRRRPLDPFLVAPPVFVWLYRAGVKRHA